MNKFYKISIDITNRCNKSCSGCNHLIPLISNFKDLSLDYLSKVFIRLQSLDFKLLCLTGGEPLLHPDLLKICELARQILPNKKIKIITNGLLLKNYFHLAKQFNDLNIYFYISSYGDLTEKDFEEIYKYFKNVNIDIAFDKSKEFENTNFDLEGKQDYNYSYNNCRDNDCLKIWDDGKLYQCPEMMRINTLVEYFNLPKLNIKEEEYSLDLFKATDNDIYLFIQSVKSCCRFCNKKIKKVFIPQKSKKNLNEWIVSKD